MWPGSAFAGAGCPFLGAENLRREDTVVGATVITVVGMTCGHCVNAVRTEISRLPGVTEVDVDLETGAVQITADPPPDAAALRGAVTEAGYEVAL
jgi:copper chaperone CopZ